MRATGRDEGFGIVEVLVGIVILGIVFAAVGAIFVRSFQTLASDRQLQVGTQIAGQTLERVRALAYDTVQAGILSAQTAGDPNVTTSGGRYYFGGEQLRTGSSAPTGTPLNPYRVTGGTGLVLNNTTYTVATYPTLCYQPVDARDQCNAVSGAAEDAILTKVTVIVSWSAGGESFEVRDQSLFNTADFGGEECFQSETHPFPAPCQSFFYGTTVAGGGQFSLVDPGGGLLLGATNTKQLDLALAQAGTTLQTEQVSTIAAFANGSSATKTAPDGTATSSGGSVGQASANSDPADATATTSSGILSQSSHGALSVFSAGSPAFYVSSDPGADTGSAVSTTSSSTATDCFDVASAPVELATTLPCASASVNAGAATMQYGGTVGGTALGAVTLASMASSTFKAYGSRFATGASGHCTSTSGDGCVAAGSDSVVGVTTIGDLPASYRPSGWEGYLVQIRRTATASFRPTTSAEAGANAVVPTATYTDIGTTRIRYWSGTGYSEANFSSTAAGSSIPAATVTQAIGPNTLVLTPQLSFGSRTTDPTTAPVCTAACEASGNVASPLTGTLRLTVRDAASNTLVDLLLSIDLGVGSSATSFKAAGDA